MLVLREIYKLYSYSFYEAIGVDEFLLLSEIGN